MTSEHAAWLAEFDDDDNVVADLLDTFTRNPDHGRWAVEQAHRRDEATAWQTAGEQLTGQGFDFIDPPPGTTTPSPGSTPSPTASPAAPAVTIDEYRVCPGAVVWLRRDWIDVDDVPADAPDRIVAGQHVFQVAHGCRQWPDHHQPAATGSPAATSATPPTAAKTRSSAAPNGAG